MAEEIPGGEGGMAKRGEERKYTEEELQLALKLQRKQPNFWKRVKVGAIAGIVSGLLAAGYESNVVEAWLSSKEAQRQVASALREERDTRSLWEKMAPKKLGGKEEAKEIPVGRDWLTKRDSQGRIISVGKDRILKGMPGHLSLVPKVPASTTALKYGAYGAGAGALLGAASWGRKKWKLRKQLRPRGK